MRPRAAFAVLWIVLALRLLATLRPASWLWGLDSLADRTPLARGIGIALFVLAAIPAVGAWVARGIEGTGRLPRAKIITAAALAAAVALLGLRGSNNLYLGDSQTWLASIAKGMHSAGGAHREPLPQAAVTLLYDGVVRPLGGTSHGAFTAAGVLLGAAYLALGIALARRAARGTAGRVLAFSVVCLGGALQLFAGYAEFYGFAVVAILLFAWLGLRSIEDGASPLPPALAYVLGGLCHAQVIFALPALAYLLAVTWRRGRRRETVIAAVASAVAGVLALLLLRYPFSEIPSEAGQAGNFLPPFGRAIPRTAYGVASPAHLAELMNVLLLAAPALPVAIALAARGRGPARPRGPFLPLLAIGPILFAAVANPQLGMVRDWDIFTLPLAVASLWAAFAAAGVLAGRAGASIAGAVLLTGFLHAAFWIDANHRHDPATERIRRVASNPALFGRQSLGEVWRYIGSADMFANRPERAAASYATAIRSDPDDRMPYRMLAQIRVGEAAAAGRGIDTALVAFHADLDRGAQRRAYAYLGGAIAALTAGRADVAMDEASRMIALEPDHPELLAFWGDLLRRGGRDLDAKQAYERALARDPDQPRARIGLACLAGIEGDRAALEEQVREALRRTPWSPQAQQFARALGQPGARDPGHLRSYIFIQ